MFPTAEELAGYSDESLFCWAVNPVPAIAVAEIGGRTMGAVSLAPALRLALPELPTVLLVNSLVDESGTRLFHSCSALEREMTKHELEILSRQLSSALNFLEPGDKIRKRLKKGATETGLIGPVLAIIETRDLPKYFGKPINQIPRIQWEAWRAARDAYPAK